MNENQAHAASSRQYLQTASLETWQRPWSSAQLRHDANYYRHIAAMIHRLLSTFLLTVHFLLPL